jgi:hypothetical protein
MGKNYCPEMKKALASPMVNHPPPQMWISYIVGKTEEKSIRNTLFRALRG